jgi:hypothetical protein
MKIDPYLSPYAQVIQNRSKTCRPKVIKLLEYGGNTLEHWLSSFGYATKAKTDKWGTPTQNTPAQQRE